jgi:hypothetical protein
MEKKLPKADQYRSTAAQMQDFADSCIWRDLQQEIKTWISSAHNELENPDLDTVKTAHLRGCIRASRDLLKLPEVIISIIQANEEDSK